MTEQDQFPVCGRELTNDVLYLLAPLLACVLLFRRKPSALKRQLARLAFNPACQRLLARAVTTQMVNRRVVRDLVNPGRELKLRAVAAERVIDFDEDFLRQVQSGLIIADPPI